MEKPKSTGTNYTKWENGENPVRIVSEVISGWECWKGTEGNRKPVRQELQFKAKQLEDIGVADNNGNPSKEQKQFYAAIVWNHNTEQFECLTIKQSTIKNAIYSLDQNEKWGDPRNYDLVINKSGSGLETSYSVMPEPKTEFAGTVPMYDLTQLFKDGNPLGDE